MASASSNDDRPVVTPRAARARRREARTRALRRVHAVVDTRPLAVRLVPALVLALALLFVQGPSVAAAANTQNVAAAPVTAPGSNPPLHGDEIGASAADRVLPVGAFCPARRAEPVREAATFGLTALLMWSLARRRERAHAD